MGVIHSMYSGVISRKISSAVLRLNRQSVLLITVGVRSRGRKALPRESVNTLRKPILIEVEGDVFFVEEKVFNARQLSLMEKHAKYPGAVSCKSGGAQLKLICDVSGRITGSTINLFGCLNSQQNEIDGISSKNSRTKLVAAAIGSWVLGCNATL